jgi:hypothetical protein
VTEMLLTQAEQVWEGGARVAGLRAYLVTRTRLPLWPKPDNAGTGAPVVLFVSRATPQRVLDRDSVEA